MEIKDTVKMMNSSDYKERFKAEYYQTLIRYSKLDAMLKKHDEGTLDFTPTCPIPMLMHQRGVMLNYLSVLKARAKIEEIDL